MFARTSTWSGSPEELQKWADHAASKVKGFVEGLPGNAGVMFLIDRDSGTALTLTLWDSQDAARATDQGTRSHAAPIRRAGPWDLRSNHRPFTYSALGEMIASQPG